MSFLLSVRKVAVGWCSLLAIPVVVLSQNSFAPSGGEYSITGKLPGDQVHPQLSFTTNGGYVVWEDNWVDGNGLGVGAMRLNNDLTGNGVAFRVNSLNAGDQEAAQVSLLNNGGAAFAWQGGRFSFQHIYSRFLSPSNNWVTGDVQVNTSTNCYQSSPVMATLLNGNVAIAYVSYNQAASGSLADVYLQMFSPAGNKLGGEVLVNQFTDNNQRSPAIAALPNGNLVVAWVSEQERWTDASNGVPSVDIYARIFDSGGAPTGNEFLVNVSSNVCAMPDVAAAADGGFMATWGERDLVVRANGWDVYARRFTSSGVGGDVVTRVNTQLFADQQSPKIRRVGSTYLDIWTSMGQDGSREGVYGQYLNDDATPSGGEFRVNTTTYGSQMHQALGSDATGRFLAAWTSFSSGMAGFDLYGQVYANSNLVVVGTNNPVFNSDPNANPNSVSNTVSSTYVISQTGGGNTNNSGGTRLSFASVKGTYNGLVYNSSGVTADTSGYITITTSAKGTTGSFTAKLQMGSSKYSFSGTFDASGAFSGPVGPFTVNLQIDLYGADQITGQISNGNWTALLEANRVVFGKTHLTSLAGTYTMVIQSTDGTMGNGIGTATVDTLGNVKWSLVLADGTKVSQSTTLSKNGAWPLYAQPYKTGGVTIGWMQFGSKAMDAFDGQCVWVKPAGASSPYSGGFTNGVTVSGSAYKAPPLFRTFGKSRVILNGGGLTAPVTNSVIWGLDNKVISQNSSVKLSVNSSSGLFQGTVTIGSGKGAAVPIQGVLFEKNNVGLGFFLGSGQSGTVNFAPNN